MENIPEDLGIVAMLDDEKLWANVVKKLEDQIKALNNELIVNAEFLKTAQAKLNEIRT